MIKNYFIKLQNIVKILQLPYQLGFVSGHAHLSAEQLLMLRRQLEGEDSRQHKVIIQEYEQRFAALVGKGYGVSFASGRMAFYSLMKVLGIGAGDEVILPAFTCSVMPNAVWRTGAQPVFADIDMNTLGSDPAAIVQKITPRTKLIVAQHSFGIPCNIDGIVDAARSRGIFLVEDSAIALDSSLNGITVGNWGDAAIFSTDHSKPLNTIIGGVLYTKDIVLHDRVRNFSDALPPLTRDHQERLYRRLLFERRYYRPERYPRARVIDLLAATLRTKNHPSAFLEADYTRHQSIVGTGYPYPAQLPSFLARLGLIELEQWGEESHRRKALLKKLVVIMEQYDIHNFLPSAYADPNRDIVPLRFAFTSPAAEFLRNSLSRSIDVGWTWFRQPIICAPDGPQSLGYQEGSCRNAEEAALTIINLPCVIPVEWEDLLLKSFRDALESLPMPCNA